MWRIQLALTRDRGPAARSLLATLGAAWLCLEVLGFFFQDARAIRSLWTFAVLVILAIAIALTRGVRPREVAFVFPGMNTRVTLTAGNLFTITGCRVIPVNEYFDYLPGDHVAPTSLHGQFIAREFSRPEQFAEEVDLSLRGQVTSIKVERPSGQSHRFPVGTVARIDRPSGRYLAAVLTHTDIQTLKATASVDDLWKCLTDIWLAARTFSNGEPIVIPLLGTGLAGVPLSYRQALSLILISSYVASQAKVVAAEIVVVMPKLALATIDVREVAREWQ